MQPDCVNNILWEGRLLQRPKQLKIINHKVNKTMHSTVLSESASLPPSRAIFPTYEVVTSSLHSNYRFFVVIDRYWLFVRLCNRYAEPIFIYKYFRNLSKKSLHLNILLSFIGQITNSGRTRAGNSDQLQGSIFVPSFQLKVPRTNCKQIALSSSSRACEHVHLKNIYIILVNIMTLSFIISPCF